MKDNNKGKKTKIKSPKPASNLKPKSKPAQKKQEIPVGYAVPNLKKAGDLSSKTKVKDASALLPAAKSSAKKRKKMKISAVSLPAFLVIVIFTAIIIWFGMSSSRTGSVLNGYLTSFDGGSGYPVNIDSSGIIATQRIGSGILLLSNDAVEILNSTAKQVVRVQHTFLNPESDIANGRAIIYSRASGRVEVVNRSGVLYKTDLGRNILTASIGKKGNIAIASQSTSAQSDLSVLDKKGKTIFSWECAAERISAVALSGNGKSVAVAVVGAANTELYSRVLVFNFDKSEPVAEFNYPENAVIKLKFGSNDTLIAVGDKTFSVISVKDNKKQDVENSTGDILERFYTFENGKTVIVLSAFGNKAQSKLVVYGSTGKLLFETNFNQEIKWVSCDANYVSVLAQDEVQSFDNTGKHMGSFKADKYAEMAVVVGKYTYLFEKGLITQYNTVSTSP